jgi:hypothetical protein
MAGPVAVYDTAFRAQLKARRAAPSSMSASDAVLEAAPVDTSIPVLGQRIEQMAASGAGVSARDLERYLGRNDLVRMNYLERGLLAARAVARLRAGQHFRAIPEQGFLTDPDLDITLVALEPQAEEAAADVVVIMTDLTLPVVVVLLIISPRAPQAVLVLPIMQGSVSRTIL